MRWTNSDDTAMPNEEQRHPDDATSSKVYYNSACPVCKAGVTSQRERMESCGITDVEWIDVHRNPERAAEVGASLEEVRERLYVVDDAGRINVGSEAFAELWNKTPRQRWLGRVIRLPIIRRLAQRTYNAFARRLYRWNRNKGHW